MRPRCLRRSGSNMSGGALRALCGAHKCRCAMRPLDHVCARSGPANWHCSQRGLRCSGFCGVCHTVTMVNRSRAGSPRVSAGGASVASSIDQPESRVGGARVLRKRARNAGVPSKCHVGSVEAARLARLANFDPVVLCRKPVTALVTHGRSSRCRHVRRSARFWRVRCNALPKAPHLRREQRVLAFWTGEARCHVHPFGMRLPHAFWACRTLRGAPLVLARLALDAVPGLVRLRDGARRARFIRHALAR